MRLRTLLLPTLCLFAASACHSGPEPTHDYDTEVAPPAELASEADAEEDGAWTAEPLELQLADDTQGAQDPQELEQLVAGGQEGEELASAPAEAAAPAQEGQQGQQEGQPPQPQVGREGSLAQESERQRLLRERMEFLAQQYIERGDELLDRADLQGALEQYSQALDVMPSNETARVRLRRVQGLMGDRFAEAAQGFEDITQREVVRRSQARIGADQALQLGNQALREGDYEGAAARYREALLILRYNPLIAEGSLDERIVAGQLEDALDLQQQFVAEQERRAQQQAQADAQAREVEEREYRRTRLRTLFSEAYSAFLVDDYSRAENLAAQILLEDPDNAQARQMRDAAQAARHANVDQKTRRDYREQWRRTFDELDQMDVPQVESLVFDDLKRWREVVMRTPLEFSATRETEDLAEKQAVIERLEAVRFAPRFVGPDGQGSPLTEIAAYLQTLTGVNFLVSTRVREELDEEQTTIRLQLPERSVKKVLDIIADTSESLRWKVEDGVVKFVTREEMLGGQVLRMFEVRDIIHPIPSFPGREINISPSGGLDPLDEDIEEREGLVVTADALETLIRDNIAPDSWTEDPNNSVRITESGTMVVNQTPEVQEQIQQLLDDLREATGIMVDIQTRFLNVEDNFLEDIGVDFRGLGQPGLGTNSFLNDFGDASTQGDLGQEIGTGTDLGAFYDDGQDGDVKGRVENLYDMSLGDENVLTGSGGLSFQWTYLNDLQMEMILRAVSKSERVELVTAPRLLVFNTARANIAVLNQVAYVQDFDVEIAQAASIADPIVGVVPDGVILDVRPVVSADRRFILMELRPTVATLRRPIQQVATTLGSQTSITIQLPELDIQRVRTTVPMPDGGTVMLGGLKISEKQDLRSGVPIVNKIPVVRFLFERKGNFVTNRKLLILIKANIVIPQEIEPTPAQIGLR